MFRRTILTVLVLAPLLFAKDPLKDAYHQAKRLRGEAQKTYAAEQAAQLAPSASGSSYLYLGFLWKYAEEWTKAAGAFQSYVDQAKVESKNRPTAMLERVLCLLDARAWDQVPPAVAAYRAQYATGRYLGRMRFCEGRALRMSGHLEEAHAAFSAGVRAGYRVAAYEAIDCLMQLGRYEEALKEARQNSDGSAGMATLIKALPNLGKPWPKLPFDNWTGKDFSNAEIREKPVLFSFWLTKMGRVKVAVHSRTNGLAKRHKGKLRVVGATLYTHFDPVTMRTEEGLSHSDEWGFIESWAKQYALEYPLCALKDSTLHDFCGVDPSHPVLPAFALGDAKGRLRYVRVGSAPWATEAMELMIRRVLSE